MFPNHSWNADRASRASPGKESTRNGASDVWCLYRLSTRTNRRAVYFFCQKYRKPRNSAKTLFTGKRRKPVNTNFRLLSFINMQNWHTAKFGKTLFIDPVNILHNNPQDYTSTTYNFLFSTETLFGRETEKERKYRFVSARKDTCECAYIYIFSLSTPPPLFIVFRFGCKRPKCPPSSAYLQGMPLTPHPFICEMTKIPLPHPSTFFSMLLHMQGGIGVKWPFCPCG